MFRVTKYTRRHMCHTRPHLDVVEKLVKHGAVLTETVLDSIQMMRVDDKNQNIIEYLGKYVCTILLFL